MMALAVLVCAFLLAKDARSLGIKPELIFDFAFWVIFSGILGARIFYILMNWDHFGSHSLEMIQVQKGGLAWQGGLTLGTIAGIVYIRWHSLQLWPMLDLVAPYIALGHAIGRIGCFLNGCCFGKEVSWGLYFPIYHARLHPTQLYESGMLLVIFLILKRFRTINQTPGKVFVWYLILASMERFIVEFFRADHSWSFWGLSIFQWASLLFITVAIYAKSNIKSRSRQ